MTNYLFFSSELLYTYNDIRLVVLLTVTAIENFEVVKIHLINGILLPERYRADYETHNDNQRG